MEPGIVNNIFERKDAVKKCWNQVFQYQYSNNKVYRAWCDALKISAGGIQASENIPFLPISFFKTHRVVCGLENPELIFESSGTTGASTSRHFVPDARLYIKSFKKCFDIFYGDIRRYCILGLLPAYLERQHSSLVMMADTLIKESNHPRSGFYLYDLPELRKILTQLEADKQPTILLGVTFALLDFAEQYPIDLKHTIVMETGGMKGRREEITRAAMHSILHGKLGVEQVHSEYGMTELLSQAYAKKDGRFFCPPWMKVLVRDEQDPLLVRTSGKGILNIIDLANMHSCAFIATDDAGEVFDDGSFMVWGRVDNSDIRGCSLLVV